MEHGEHPEHASYCPKRDTFWEFCSLLKIFRSKCCRCVTIFVEMAVRCKQKEKTRGYWFGRLKPLPGTPLKRLPVRVVMGDWAGRFRKGNAYCGCVEGDTVKLVLV